MKILLVGTGLTNAVIFDKIKNDGHKIEIIEKRPNLGGNCFTEDIDGIQVHKYGPHIFHTNDSFIWNYVNSFCHFKRFNTQVMATDLEGVYNLPYNMNTFTKFWPNMIKPSEVEFQIKNEVDEYFSNNPYIDNLECAAIKKVGTTVYNKLIKPYTEKQWGCSTKELPRSIIDRLPVRFSYNNDYFDDEYQGVPVEGYTELILRMFAGGPIRFNTDFIEDGYLERINEYDLIVYSGTIDNLYNGLNDTDVRLPYRSLRFDNIMDDDTQGCAIMTYDTDKVDYTRITESKYFMGECSNSKTIKTYEYPCAYEGKNEPFYPIENKENRDLYLNILNKLPDNVLPVGRLGSYRYYNMDKAIEEAFKVASFIKLLGMSKELKPAHFYRGNNGN